MLKKILKEVLLPRLLLGNQTFREEETGLLETKQSVWVLPLAPSDIYQFSQLTGKAQRLTTRQPQAAAGTRPGQVAVVRVLYSPFLLLSVRYIHPIVETTRFLHRDFPALSPLSIRSRLCLRHSMLVPHPSLSTANTHSQSQRKRSIEIRVLILYSLFKSYIPTAQLHPQYTRHKTYTKDIPLSIPKKRRDSHHNPSRPAS